MKSNRILQFAMYALAAFAFAFITACEGPQGPPGPAGTDGADGTNGLNGINGVDANETCKVCHNDETTVLVSKIDQFEEGKHSGGTYYDRNGECAACHNNEGFLARQTYTDEYAEAKTFTGAASAISCYTCHNIHQAYDADDWGLTYATQVTSTFFGQTSPGYDPVEFNDFGSANICVQCHQARDRGDIPAFDATAEYTITSSHWGPHYGIQGNVIHSSGGVPIVGSATYPTFGNGHAQGVATVSCTDCHMYEGNHNLEVNYESCAGCHNSADEAEDAVDALQAQVHTDMLALGKLLAAAGVMTPNLNSAETDTLGYSPKRDAVATADQAKAVYNYMVVYQDHSKGVHNKKYIQALLTNSTEAVQ